MGVKLNEAMEELKAQAEKEAVLDAAALVVIQGIKAQIDAALEKDDAEAVAALKELSAKLGSDDQALADAIAANTVPVEPPPVPEEPVF